MKLLVATRNRGKIEELERLFADLDEVELIGLDSFPDAPDVVEDANTFEGNAIKKARELAMATGLVTLADDSGLEVDVLDGAPGVLSARYAGGHDDAANNAKLLRALADVEDPRRTARFRCVLALFDAKRGEPLIARGVVEGRIARAPRGAGGFGYDPLFLVGDGDRTMAELTSEEKNSMSHRAAAAKVMRDLVRAYLSR